MNEEIEFNDMTNAQLKEACGDFGLEVIAKNPAKPNKGEYVATLEAFKAKQADLHGERLEEKAKATEVVEQPATKSTTKRKPQSKSTLTKLDLFKKDRYIIHDQQETQTKDEMVSVSWGNRLIGNQTDWIDLSGTPQYIRKGAAENLKGASMFIQEPKPSGGVRTVRKDRFIVVQTENLSETELAELAAVQKMRNSKLA